MSQETQVIDISAQRRKKHSKNNFKKKRRFKNKLFMILPLIIVVFIVGAAFMESGMRYWELKSEKRELLRQNKQLKRDREKIKKSLKVIKNLDVIEEYARKKLHLIKPGEILYRLPEDSDGKKD